jgi:Response regulator containing a CheY-like receiver domain and an HD-GYP domain
MGNLKATILVVDDTSSNIMLLSSLLKENYRVKVATNGEKAIFIVQADPPDLILLDIMMPGIDGYETCRRIKSEPKYSDIPIIFLTAKSDDEDESKGLELGAVDYIIKPINPLILFSRIKTQLSLKQARDSLKDNNKYLEEEVKRRIKEIELIQEVSIAAMASLAETRDNETGKHIQRTQLYVKQLALELKNNELFKDYLTDKSIRLIVKSTPLHDIGKVGIPDNILLKAGGLTKEEFEIMKTHTVIGKVAIERAEFVIDIPNTFFKYAKEIIYFHHEKWDGSGYPEKISGYEIPVSARIMAVADVYDALVTKRVYKEAFSHEMAVNIIKEDSGKHFDPIVVEAFLKLEKKFKEISYELKD